MYLLKTQSVLSMHTQFTDIKFKIMYYSGGRVVMVSSSLGQLRNVED